MRLGILTAGDGWHARDLRRAAAERSLDVELIDFRTLTADESSRASVGQDSDPDVRIGILTHEKVDAILVRTMPPGSLEQVVFRMDVLHAWQARRVTVLNPPRALETCIDKYLTTHRLAFAGLPVPRTWTGQRADEALPAFEALGGDVVVKPLFGSEGRGLVRVTDPETAWRVFVAVERAGGVIYQQKFIRHPGWDLRVFVLGGRVLAAMRRHAKDGWRTNVAQGGRGERVALTPAEEKLAVAAAEAVGCPIAGADLLPGPDGMLVLEVNAVPGWRALTGVCGVDVAAAVLEFVCRQTAR
jgi:ribosomal protein S6--L-glutamate ligase